MNFTTTPTASATPARAQMFEGVPHLTHLAGHPYSEIDWFDVPAETYATGNQTGIHVAAHAFKLARDTDEEGFLLASIHAACRITAQHDAVGSSAATLDKVGAAVGFMATIQQLLIQACKELDFSSIISESLKAYEAEVEQDLQEMRERRAALMAAITPAPRPERVAA